jgi:hypothetical protein
MAGETQPWKAEANLGHCRDDESLRAKVTAQAISAFFAPVRIFFSKKMIVCAHFRLFFDCFPK